MPIAFGVATPLRRFRTIILLIVAASVLAGCATTPPSNPDNACSIFREKDDWYDSAKDVYKRWGVPIHVQLAIMRQESTFIHDARPPREHLLGFIPWFRPTSAYGYAQVKDSTWEWYEKDTDRWGADRDDFDDADDFVGWYVHGTYTMLGVSKWDARKQYLAYHEGRGGYKRGTYRHKRWLLKVAARVKANASRYYTQLKGCEDELNSGWDLWPFW